MDQLVAQVVVDEIARGGSQVAIIVHVAFELVVDQGEHAEATDVEFALVVESRLLNILLHDKRLLAVIVALA